MRITFILPHAGISGGIRVVAIYARMLKQRGHQVCVVSTPWEPPGRRGKLWRSMRQIVHRISPGDRAALDPSHLHGLDLEHRVLRQPRPVTDSDVPDADVVVATWWETAPWVMNLGPRKGAKAYFVQDYGAHGGQPLEKVAPTWRLPMHKIVISQFLVRLLGEHGCDRDYSYVPNAVDTARFRAPKRSRQPQPTVGFLYSTAPQKGCDLMLDAVRLARRRVKNLKLVTYGPGDPEPHLPLPHGAVHHAYPADDQLSSIYAACDMWLFGSRLEGFGLPILEAMACRTPVIATSAGAAPELLAQGGGVLVDMNAASMAEQIVHMANLPEGSWRVMSDAALRTASSYSWDDATDRFESALERAILVHAHETGVPQLAQAAFGPGAHAKDLELGCFNSG
jgi:glycosyltransferase involved in cell wall biosynthesis